LITSVDVLIIQINYLWRMEFSSKLLEKAVHEMAQLPGIGKRTALRLVLHLLKQPQENTRYLS